MATCLESNKTKIAKRVIEVFDFFDNKCRQATVMDIVREYGRPQSSTSELLQSLVEMGLLYKDAQSRSYSPTPRLATLGFWAQPEMIRNGQLFTFMDRFAQSSRLGIGLFGMVSTQVQVFRWVPGVQRVSGDIGCGTVDRLSDSAVGQLLLSTLPGDSAGRVLRRLNAEAPEEKRFNGAAMTERVNEYRFQRHAIGDAGFGGDAKMAAMLLPPVAGERPLALGVVYPGDGAVDSSALIRALRRGLTTFNDRKQDEIAPQSAFIRAV